MRRLLMVSTEYPPMKAGIANLALSTYTALRERGEDVYLMAPAGSQFAEPDRQFPLFIRPRSGSFQWMEHFRNAFRLRRIIKSHGIGQVLYMDAAARCAAFPWVPRIPFSVVINGTELIKRGLAGEWLSGRFLLQKLSVRSARSVICISRATRELFERVFPGKAAEVIYPCYDGKRIFHPARHPVNPYPETSGKLVFLTVSRLAERKGHSIVLEILRRNLSRLPAFHYFIVGEGPERAKLQELVRTLGLAGHVSFLGAVPDDQLGAYYHYADIFIMLSRRAGEGVEGFGLTYVEASASGTAVVGSDHGGAAEAVMHGVSGITVPADSLESASEEIVALALDKPRRDRMAEDGRRWVEANFSSDRYCDRLREALDASAGPVTGGP